MRRKNSEHQEVWDLLYELIDNSKETDKKIDNLRKRQEQTDQQIDKTNKGIDKTYKSIDKLKKIVGGMGNNNGHVAENFFYNSFVKHRSFGGYVFDFIDKNLERTHKDTSDEFDIILTNSDFMVIVEVKYNFHPEDVKTVLKKIRNFRILFPNYKDYTIFGAIAGMAMPQKTIEQAKKYGFFVFTQDGTNLKILNDQVVAYNK